MAEQQPRRVITVVELFSVAILIAGAGLMFWKSTDVRLSTLEMRMNSTDKTVEQINVKLDKNLEGINDIKIVLQNKQDKKNN